MLRGAARRRQLRCAGLTRAALADGSRKSEQVSGSGALSRCISHSLPPPPLYRGSLFSYWTACGIELGSGTRSGCMTGSAALSMRTSPQGRILISNPSRRGVSFCTQAPPPGEKLSAGRSQSRSSSWSLLAKSATGVASGVAIWAVLLMFQEEVQEGFHKWKCQVSKVGGSMRDMLEELIERLCALLGPAADRISGAAADMIEILTAARILANSLALVIFSDVDMGHLETSHRRWLYQVAATLADLAANEQRRARLVGAGSGQVLDWLLDLANGEHGPYVKGEAARALAHLIADPGTCQAVIGRRGALPKLLNFALTSSSPAERKERHVADPGSQSRLLVAAVMDLVSSDVSTESSETLGRSFAQQAATEDVMAVLKVLEGSPSQVEHEGGKDSARMQDGPGGGVHGIGIRTMGGTGIVRLQNLAGIRQDEVSHSVLEEPKLGSLHSSYSWHAVAACEEKQASWQELMRRAPGEAKLVNLRVMPDGEHGLWDDLWGEAVALPLAAWALASWTAASSENRATVAELDPQGSALEAGQLAADRVTRHHVAVAIEQLLEEEGLKIRDVALGRWSNALLGTAVAAGLQDDLDLACTALRPLAGCLARSHQAKSQVADEGLPALRQVALRQGDEPQVQRAVALALKAAAGPNGAGLTKEESKSWSPLLLRWACGADADSATREAATAVLEGALRQLGSAGAPITQAWLASLLMTLVTESSAEGKAKIAAAARRASDKDAMSEKSSKKMGAVQGQTAQRAAVAAAQLARVVAQESARAAMLADAQDADVAEESHVEATRTEWQTRVASDLLGLGGIEQEDPPTKAPTKKEAHVVTPGEAMVAMAAAMKSVAELAAEHAGRQEQILHAGGLALIRHLLLADQGATGGADKVPPGPLLVSSSEGARGLSDVGKGKFNKGRENQAQVPENRGLTDGSKKQDGEDDMSRSEAKQGAAAVKKQALRLLAVLSVHPPVWDQVRKDGELAMWLERCADNGMAGLGGEDKMKSFARQVLLHCSPSHHRLELEHRQQAREKTVPGGSTEEVPRGQALQTALPLAEGEERWGSKKGQLAVAAWPRYEDGVFLMDTSSAYLQRLSRPSERQVAAPGQPHDRMGTISAIAGKGLVREMTGGTGDSSPGGVGSPNGEPPSKEGGGKVEHTGATGGDNPQPQQRIRSRQSTSLARGEESREEDMVSQRGEENDSPTVKPPPGTIQVTKNSRDLAPSPSTSLQSNLSEGAGNRAGFGRPEPATSAGGRQENAAVTSEEPAVDLVFVHGLRGGPFKTWRVADSITSTPGRAGLVVDATANLGISGTCWPSEWLAADLPPVRMLSIKYKTSLTEWTSATLPLEEVSSMVLNKLLAAGVGQRPVIFITHSMGGLVVKSMLAKALEDKRFAHLSNNTIGIVFYSCPHFGSRLADVPWRMGYLLRPAPSVGDLRRASPRLEELNHVLRQLYLNGQLDVLNFAETKVTPVVTGYGGMALRMEVVPLESAYPGFGRIVLLDGTDHVNSCKPESKEDPAYRRTLEFILERHLAALKKGRHTGGPKN